MSLMRDPRNNYALVQTGTLAKSYRHLQLDDFLQAQAVTSDAVSLANPALFTELDAMVAKIDPDQWKAYLRFHVGNAMAPYLSTSFRDADFAFSAPVLRDSTTKPTRDPQVLHVLTPPAGRSRRGAQAPAYLPPHPNTD